MGCTYARATVNSRAAKTATQRIAEAPAGIIQVHRPEAFQRPLWLLLSPAFLGLTPKTKTNHPERLTSQKTTRRSAHALLLYSHTSSELSYTGGGRVSYLYIRYQVNTMVTYYYHTFCRGKIHITERHHDLP